MFKSPSTVIYYFFMYPLEYIIRSGHVYSPHELFPLRLVVDLFHGYIMLLCPSHRDPRIQVVQLGGSKGNILILILVCSLNLKLLQLLQQSLNSFLLFLAKNLLISAASILVSLLGMLQVFFCFFNIFSLLVNFFPPYLPWTGRGF